MGRYEVVRSTTVAADPARVHDLVDDFHQWVAWSPWEDLDPALERTYDGPDRGVGARYSWQGNRKAGQGTMEITGSTPDQVDVDLHFLRPFKSQSSVSFEIQPTGPEQTEVVWRMRGEQTGLAGLFGKLVPMDRLIGKDFEKGLARLKTVAEQ